MSLEVIYLTRHGFRSPFWVSDTKTGTYKSTVRSLTNIPSDPPLTAKGVTQSHELAAHLLTLDPPIERFYSSPYYRCLQTINPTVALLPPSTDPERRKIRGENGVGEWHGTAHFDHPEPAEPKILKTLFPLYDEHYVPVIKPNVRGESIEDLHDRTAYALHRIIERSDREGVKAIVICTHAASLIAIGRALTGRMPGDVDKEDFRPFTCGVSTFVRKGRRCEEGVDKWEGLGKEIPSVDWRDGKGVSGGWRMTVDGDCSFLSEGEERGWHFFGDESFIDASGTDDIVDAGGDFGEGKKKVASLNPSKL